MSLWPLPLRIALILLGLGAGSLVAVLAKFWGANPEYADRFLIILASGWIAWQRRGSLACLPLRPLGLGWPILLLGASAFPVGWFLQAQIAPKPIVIWWLALAWITAAAGFTLALAGYRHLRVLAFPLVFILFACPIPNRILVPLQARLQQATTTVSAAVLPLLGIPIEREGFILRLPGGDLGVAEACSGVRSVTALTALAAFVACLKDFGPLRGFALLAFSVPVIAAVNAFRVILSGLIQEWFGSRYIQGDWHEALGIGMIFVGLGFVMFIASLLERETQDASPSPDSTSTKFEPAALPSRATFAASAILLLALIATISAQILGLKAESSVVATAPLEQISTTLGSWTAVPFPKKDAKDPDIVDYEIPHFVAELLTFDKAILRKYRNDLGREVDVWVIYWSSQSMVKGYHHPDICVQNRGYTLRDRDRKPMTTAGGSEVPLTIREFVSGRDKSQRMLVLYWTQEGRHIWTEEDELSAQSTGDSHTWLSDRLFAGPETQATGRIVVLVSTSISGNGTSIRQDTLDFTRRLADSLYELCPWAKPQS